MIYTCQFWGQNEPKIKQISELQDKALRIINFKPKNHPVSELYESNEILKLTNYIKLHNCMFVSANQIPIFNNLFIKTNEIHRHNSRHTSRNTVEHPQPMTESYGRYSVRFQAATTWNNLQNIIPIDMLTENYRIVKNDLTNYFFDHLYKFYYTGCFRKNYGETLNFFFFNHI